MLYYAKIDGKILGPFGRSELRRLRDDGAFGSEGQWCTAEGDTESWQSPEMIDSIPYEPPGSLWGAIIVLSKWTLTAFTLVLLAMPIWGILCEAATIRSILYVYAGLLVFAMLTRSISRFGLFFRVCLFVTAMGFSVIQREAVQLAEAHSRPSVISAYPESRISKANASLPDLKPLDYPPSASEDNIDLHLRHTLSQYNEYPALFENPRYQEIFLQKNETDTLPVERAQYFAQNIAEIPYVSSTGPQDVFQTLKNKQGNCFAKSVALYDMMTRGGAKNVYLVFGMLYMPDPRPHAWIYWEKDSQHFIVETTSEGMFYDIAKIKEEKRLREWYCNHRPQWAFSAGQSYVFGR